MKYIKIAEGLYTPDYNVMKALAVEMHLPTDIEECYVNEQGYLAKTITVYHNRVEEVIVEKDPERVELAKALMNIKKHLNSK